MSSKAFAYVHLLKDQSLLSDGELRKSYVAMKKLAVESGDGLPFDEIYFVFNAKDGRVFDFK